MSKPKNMTTEQEEAWWIKVSNMPCRNCAEIERYRSNGACIPCSRISSKSRSAKYYRKLRNENPDEAKKRSRESSRKQRAKNKEADKARKKRWLLKNPNYHLEYVKKWQIINSDKVAKSQSEYRANNADKLREKGRIRYRKNRRKRIDCVISSQNKRKQQSAADQFFILAGAAEQISTALQTNQNK